MKLTIKRADGASVEVEGSQEECLAAIQATLGYNLQGLGQAPSVIPTVWPYNPNIIYKNDGHTVDVCNNDFGDKGVTTCTALPPLGCSHGL